MAPGRKPAFAIAFIIAFWMPAYGAAQTGPAEDGERASLLSETESVNKLQQELDAARRRIDLLESRVETVEEYSAAPDYSPRIEYLIRSLEDKVRRLERSVDRYRLYLFAAVLFAVLFSSTGGALFAKARAKKADKAGDDAGPAQG